MSVLNPVSNSVRLVRYLSNLKEDELAFVNRTVSLSVRKHIPVEKAAEYSSIVKGKTYSMFNDEDILVNVEVKKINQKWVRVFNPRTKETKYVLPNDLGPAVEEVVSEAVKVKRTRRSKKTETVA